MSTVFMNNSQDRKSPITSSTIQKLLDENLHLILCIAEHQNKGNAAECVSYQQVLHRNLVYLATIADYNQQNIQQPLNNNPLGPFISSNNTVTNPSSSESLNQTSSANFPPAFSVHAPDSNMNSTSTSFNSYNSSGSSSIVSVGFSVSNSLSNNSSSSHSNNNVSSAPIVNSLSSENQQHHVTVPRQTISSDNVIINSPYHHGNTPNSGDIDKTAVLASGPDGSLPSTTVAPAANNQQSDVQAQPQTAVCAANLAAYEQSIENVVAKIVGSTSNVSINEETTFNASNIDSTHGSTSNMKNFNSLNHANPNYMAHSNSNNSNFHSTDKNRSALYPYSNNMMASPYNHMVSSSGGSLINAPPYYRYPAGINTTTNNPEAAPFQTAGPYFPPHQYPSSHMVANQNYQNQNFQHKQQHSSDDIGRSQNQLFSGSFQGTNKFSHSTNHPSTYQLGAENYPMNISNDMNSNNQQPSANLRSSYTVTVPNYSGGVPTPAYEHSRMNYGPPSSHMSHEIMNNSGYHGNQQHLSAVGGYHGNSSYGTQIYPVGHFPYTASNVNSGGPNLAPPPNPMGYHGNAGSNNAFYGQNSANQLTTNSSYGQHNPTNPYF